MALDPNYQTLAQITITALNHFIYGIYTTTFGFCASILYRKSTILKLVTAIFLFTFTTVEKASSFTADIYGSCESCHSKSEYVERLYYLAYYFRFASSAVADGILLLRYYAVLGRRWRTIVLPGLIYLGSHIAGFIVIFESIPDAVEVVAGVELHGFKDVAVGMTGLVIGLNNLLMSSLIGFRIFATTREVAPHFHSKPRRMYNTAVAATLESGVLYSVFLAVTCIFQIKFAWPRSKPDDYTNFTIWRIVISALLRCWSSVAGIASTTIIVRIALGRSIDQSVIQTV
ncbi:hypothetical protein VNI00_014784 [Paramarasmius palmivorus]|uniref:Uncharacterized protein n=1 Tax=Paramarasmius palmivorus TaxID=297713 RepID=A0AAW0BQI0_9AGAR